MRKEGTKAPDFTLPDQDGSERSLSDWRGTWVLLYFYPKDDTPGCTKEACTIRDNFKEFSRLKIAVVGVSVDSVASHKKFAIKYDLPFTLLADADKKVVNLYGVWAKKKMMGREYMGTVRSSYLIDASGTVAKVYAKVEAAGHADQVLADLRTLK